MSASTEVVWDGSTHSYRPGPDWRTRVSPKVQFHTEEDPELDPVTYEVVRHRLWTINIAHGDMVTRISGSPCFQALDFNMCILTEDGEIVMNAPYLQYLDSGAALAIPYILEHFGDSPGVEDGDVYVSNDPWIAAVHQMDVFYGVPVFVDGRLFAWVSNAGHQYDLGGVAAGGWPESAVDVFHDPVVLPPFKLVERGHVRPDLEALYLRQSRFPGLVALDHRAQMAGCRFAAGQLQRACEEFSPATVKAVMRRVLDTAQQAFREKLLRIPDGRWSEVMYFDEPLPGDRHTQRVQVNFTKIGDRLKVDNLGTQAQEPGPNGMTYVALTGTTIGALTLVMLQDQLFSLGGAARQVDFDPTPGLVNCVDYPAAVSGGVMNVCSVIDRMMGLIGRMIACDPDQAGDGVMPGADLGLVVVSGVDDRGRTFGTAFTEVPGSSGATSWRDGIDTSGWPYIALGSFPNTEEVESFHPLLTLWKRQLADSGAPGQWRGGGSATLGVMEYRSSTVAFSTNTAAMGISGSDAPGIMGGYPASTIEYRLAKRTNIREQFARSHMPTSIEELKAEAQLVLRGKSTGNALEPDDVLQIRNIGGSGYGDPMLREPQLVADDVREGWVSLSSANRIYGVIIEDDTGKVDSDATDRTRDMMRAERAAWTQVDPVNSISAGVERVPATGEPPRPVHASVTAIDHNGERVLACSHCNATLAPYAGNYRSGLLYNESPVTELPMVQDPSFFLDDPIVLRRYCCPTCQVLMVAEVVKADEPHLTDMCLFPPASIL